MSDKKYTAADIRVVDPQAYKEYPVDISKQGFQSNFRSATSKAVAFAKTRVINFLPEKIKYLVYMNASNDMEPLEEGECKFSGDPNRKVYFDDLEVAEFLWREGKVPEWINVSVCDASDEYTEVRLVCCGRFSSKKEHMYHVQELQAPFHVLGPDLPQGFDLSSGEKFDLKDSAGRWRELNE